MCVTLLMNIHTSVSASIPKSPVEKITSYFNEIERKHRQLAHHLSKRLIVSSLDNHSLTKVGLD